MAITISIDEIRKRKTATGTSGLAAADSSRRPSPSSYVILSGILVFAHPRASFKSDEALGSYRFGAY